MMRPRSYSTLNRAVAKAIGHSVNDYYRQRDKQKKYDKINTYKATNNNAVKMPQVNNTEGNETVIGWIIAIMFILIGLAVIFPSIMWLYLFLIILGFIFIR